eukprot:CAMPEP_0169165056 /NCGR_PEP_ID=MMETSP1015-20121227/59205_1 /TAXON_ID=342587 /ORGANISM="Karlodinium micrum, Strain CCMP2283" /LENGTH=45 /DNA_ID= /DNA_START= /DNA_END= /DNA_ORIENTATION=
MTGIKAERPLDISKAGRPEAMNGTSDGLGPRRSVANTVMKVPPQG